MSNKTNKAIGLLHKLLNNFPQLWLLTMDKSFVQILIMVTLYKTTFHYKNELMQWKVVLAMTGSISGSSKDNSHQKLGF